MNDDLNDDQYIKNENYRLMIKFFTLQNIFYNHFFDIKSIINKFTNRIQLEFKQQKFINKPNIKEKNFNKL